VVKDGSFFRVQVEAPLAGFVDDAYRGAYGDAPDPRRWAGWVRSFRHFGALVASPMAARNSKKKRRDPSLRPRYFENEVFRFYDFYAVSERRLAELATLAYDYFVAGELSRAAEDRFVAASRIDDLAEPRPQPIDKLPALPWVPARAGVGRPLAQEPPVSAVELSA
jgi:hypothetical protein